MGSLPEVYLLHKTEKNNLDTQENSAALFEASEVRMSLKGRVGPDLGNNRNMQP
jgi:hypothetical protein